MLKSFFESKELISEMNKNFKAMEEAFYKERKQKLELLDKLEEYELELQALQIRFDDLLEDNKKNLARASNADYLCGRYQIYLGTDLLVYLKEEKIPRAYKIVELFALNVEKDETVFGGYSKRDVKAYMENKDDNSEGGIGYEPRYNENSEDKEL